MKQEEAAPGALHLRLANDLRELSPMRDAVEQFALAAGMPEVRRLDLHLTLEELVVNVIRYAWDGGAHELDVFLTGATNEIRARIEDDGRPFNPLERPPFDVNTPLEERGEGGLGIHMICQLTDDRAYQRRGGRNVLEVALRWPAAAGPA